MIPIASRFSRTFAILLVLAAGPVLLVPADAEAASCTRPDKPKLPDAKKAKAAEMEAAQKALTDYTGKMNAYLKCLDKARADGQAEHKSLSDQWNKAVDIYAKRKD